MKINSKITELLFNLSEIESSENSQLLAGEASDLRNNLLKLYRSTENTASRETIIAIMTEAGYPWFGKLARAGDKTVVSAANQGNFMSEEDFLDLLPINGHFH